MSELLEAVRRYALEFAPPGQPFVLKSGASSNYYLDCRKLTLNPWGLNLVVEAFWEKLWTFRYDAVGGPTVGADPIVGGLLYKLGTQGIEKRGFLVRSEEKVHGKSGRMIGNLESGDETVIIEDVVTTGSSVLSVIDVVRERGAKVVKVLSIVDRNQGGSEFFAKEGISYSPLLHLNQVLLNIDPKF